MTRRNCERVCHIVVAACLSLLLPPAAAWALTITQTQSFSVPVSLTATDILNVVAYYPTVPVTISQFDSSLGQLTQVALTVSATATWDSFSIQMDPGLGGQAVFSYSRSL
jgi:hypothetical protein